MAITLLVPQGIFAQQRAAPGTKIQVRADATIDSREGDLANYRGFVADDVRARDGRMVIPAGSAVEVKVRPVPYNALRLDLEWINIGGLQYTVETDPFYVHAQEPANASGGIIGALQINGDIGGREIHIPRGTVLTFMLEDPVIIGEPNLPYDRDRSYAER